MASFARALAAVVAIVLLVSACATESDDPALVENEEGEEERGSDGEEEGEAPDGVETELKTATLRLDWTYSPNHVPFLYARDMGWYEEVGIDLDVLEGQGSNNAIQLVASGDDTFAYAGTEAMVLFRGQGVPAKSILVVQRRSSYATVCYEEVGFAHPTDLEGRSVIMTPQAAYAPLWPAYLELNGADQASVTLQNADFATALTLFLEGEADCYIGLHGNDALRATMLGDSVDDAVPWTDHGVGLMGHSLITRDDTIAEDADMVRDFVAVSVRAWREVCDDVSAAADFFIEQYPEAHEDDFRRDYTRLALPLECEKTQPGPGDDGTALSVTDDDVWTATLDFLEQYSDLSNREETNAYYTNEFVPAG